MEVLAGIGAQVNVLTSVFASRLLSEHGDSKAADPRRGLSLGPSLAHVKLLIPPFFFWTQSQWGWVKAVGRAQPSSLHLSLLVQASSGGGGSTKAVVGARGLASGEDELGTCGTRRRVDM